MNSLSVEEKFRDLCQRWKRAIDDDGIGFSSSIIPYITHPLYMEIIAIGMPAVPFILEELEKEYDFWSPALHQITGENPVPEAAAGYGELIQKAWLDWGRLNGHLKVKT